MSAAATQRLVGVDLARGVAVLSMVQTHAYDGWVRDDARTGVAFAVTRVIATLALPSFLLLAGVALALRVSVAEARGETRAAVRRGLVRRGLLVVLVGYGYSALCAVIDGAGGLDTLLRADVLHGIGLSVATLALLGLRGGAGSVGAGDLETLRRRAALLGLLVWLSCPWLSRAAGELTGPQRYLAALFVDVPQVTRMPVIPLLAWSAAGAALSGSARRVSPRAAWLAGAGLAAAVSGTLAFRLTLAHTGLSPARDNLAILPNAVDLLGRALCVLALGLALASQLRGMARRALLSLGRHSLLVYAVHLPFCYGRLSAPFARSLSMSQASAALLVLLLLCACVSLVRERAARATLKPA